MIWTGGSFPINMVSSDSMKPTLSKGDIIAWTPAKIEDIKKNDVIVFKSHVNTQEEKIIVHRVTDIKKDKTGNTILETKGDHNQYTDQKGPHIPEPYIKQDHLLGKTISIGETPVKIPFIGQIGLWINQGIEKISQPSASKGTLPMIGIFTPMITSIIILFVLIFTYPEKNKTMKEKIKNNIFGPKTINLKKTFIIFLAAYLIFFSMIHVFAHDQTTASLGIEAPSPKSSIDLGTIKKGQETFEQNLPVTNPGVTNVKGLIYGTDELTPYLEEKTFELKPGEAKNIPIKAKTEETDTKGAYKAKIMIYSSPFWTIFSDKQIKNIYNFNPEFVILTLDLIISLILTTITITIIAALTLIEKQYHIIQICRSWYKPKKTIIKKHQTKKIQKIKIKTKNKIRKILELSNIELLDDKIEKIKTKNLTKPIAASIIVIPLLFLINNQITGMIIAGLLSGILAFLISCKQRKKIILSTIITLTFFTLIITSIKGLNILKIENGILNITASVTATSAIYLLFLGVLMIPITLSTWLISRYIRNVKEQRNPLLILEGRCDL